jgi:rare lipoprotein A
VCAAFAQSASAPAGGRVRARGQRFDPNGLTMAHKTLPFGTRVKVNNTKNKRNVVVRVNDRGPTQPDRIGDVSQAAAARLGMLRSGLIDARLEVVGAAPARKKP